MAGLVLSSAASADTVPSDDYPPTQVATFFGTGITLGIGLGESGSLIEVSVLDGSQAASPVRIALGDTETVVELRRRDEPDFQTAVAVVDAEQDDNSVAGLDLNDLDLNDLDLNDLDLNDLDLDGLDLDGLDPEGFDPNGFDPNDFDLNDFDPNDFDPNDLDLGDLLDGIDLGGLDLNDLETDGLDLSELDLDGLVEKYDESSDQLNSGLRSADSASDGPFGTLPRD